MTVTQMVVTQMIMILTITGQNTRAMQVNAEEVSRN
jgi:hypothetical protein